MPGGPASFPRLGSPLDIGASFEFVQDVGESADAIKGEKWKGPSDCRGIAWPKLGCKWIVDFEIDSVEQGKEDKRKQMSGAERNCLYITAKSSGGGLRSE